MYLLLHFDFCLFEIGVPVFHDLLQLRELGLLMEREQSFFLNIDVVLDRTKSLNCTYL